MYTCINCTHSFNGVTSSSSHVAYVCMYIHPFSKERNAPSDIMAKIISYVASYIIYVVIKQPITTCICTSYVYSIWQAACV